MPERLISGSGIKLYGREVLGVDLDEAALAEPGMIGQNRFLEVQVSAGDPRLARIYGYSYNGAYYEMSFPTMFMVHGPGTGAAPRFPRAAPAHGRRPGPRL